MYNRNKQILKGVVEVKNYITRDREAGNEIERFETLAEAEAAIAAYEEEDKRNGDYTPDFYEIKKLADFQVWSVSHKKGELDSGDEWLQFETDDKSEAIRYARKEVYTNRRDGVQYRESKHNQSYETEIRTDIFEENGGYDYDTVPFEISEKTQLDIASYMRDDIRESLHGDLAPCTPEEFDTEYLKKEPGFRDLLSNEFPEVLAILDAYDGV